MKDKVTCQNCGGQAERDYDICPYGISEEYIKCKCGYNYEFAYGHHMEKYPGKPTMEWSYLDPVKRIVEEESDG